MYDKSNIGNVNGKINKQKWVLKFNTHHSIILISVTDFCGRRACASPRSLLLEAGEAEPCGKALVYRF